jgi:ATP-dependent DNA helicase RecG
MQLSWDSYLYQNATIEDIDLSKVSLFIRKVNEVKRFYLEGNEINALEKLSLIKESRPTHAAMILFSKENLRYNVHIGRFKTPDLIIADKMISGNLYDVLDEAMREIISHLKFAFEITGKTTSRTEIPDYPLEAIRELMVNALVHRDYRSPIDIQIKIFDQSISVFNPSGLFGDLTIEDLKTDNYRASTRNKLIAEAFYLTKDIEKYGSGFIRIRKVISAYPTMKFEYKEIANGFLAELNYSIQKISTVDGTKDVTKGGTKGGTKEQVEFRRGSIIVILKKNKTSTIDDLSKILNIPRRTVLRDIEQLKKDNIIKRKGSRKEGYWEVVS